MESPLPNKNPNKTILSNVDEGMRVCDSTGDEIGKVRQVFLGAVSDKMTAQGGQPRHCRRARMARSHAG